MKKLIPFLLRSIWALSLVVISGTYVFGQDYVVRQDSIDDYGKRLYFDMVDATDGYTSETGLTPTCTVLKPGATAYASCAGSVVEIGTGTYRITLGETEWENLGNGSLYITNAGARPARLKYSVVDGSSMYKQGANLMPLHSDLNNTYLWVKSGTTVTANSTADYIGYTMMDTVTGDGANTEHRVYSTLKKYEGSGEYYYSAEVKSGTINNLWFGDENTDNGVDLNTSTGAVTPTVVGGLKGWRIEKISSTHWRLHIRLGFDPTTSTAPRLTVALGNGTAVGGPPTFVTSGTMIVSKVVAYRAEDVAPELLDTVLPSLQAGASGSSITLSGNEPTTTNVHNNKEICVHYGYASSLYVNTRKLCTCISAYNGTTKVATLSPAISVTPDSNYKYKIGGHCPLYIPSVGSVVGAVGSVTATANANVVSMAADTVTASAVATNAIGSNELAQAAADKVWNTAPEDGSASTALGYLDAIKKYVANKMSVVGSNYTIYKDDQTTSYATGTTNSAGRDPD